MSERNCPHYVNRWGTCEICHAYKPNEALDAERAAHLATRQELSAALARVAELERLFMSWQEQALYLQSQHEPCETHHGARRACGQCMSSTEQHLANARAEVETLETLLAGCDERLDEFSSGYCAVPPTANADAVPVAVYVAMTTMRTTLAELRAMLHKATKALTVPHPDSQIDQWQGEVVKEVSAALAGKETP